MKKHIAQAVFCLSGIICFAGPPPDRGVVYDETTKTITYTVPEGEYAFADDFWITNQLYDTKGTLLPPAECPTNVEHFILRGVSSKSVLKSWLGANLNGELLEGSKRTATNAVWSVEKGVLWLMTSGVGEESFSTFYKRPDIRLNVGPEGVIRFANEAVKTLASNAQLHTAGMITLTGGRIEDIRNIPLSVSKVPAGSVSPFSCPQTKYTALIMSGKLNVAAHTQESVIRALYLQCDNRQLGNPVEFAVAEGGTLRIDAPIGDFVLTSGTRYPGGFIKTGAGTLILTQASDLTGTVFIREGTVKLAPRATFGRAMLIISAGARVLLSDGSFLDGPFRTLAAPAVVNEAEVHLDASVFKTEADKTVGGYIRSIRNLGTLSNAFTRVSGESSACIYKKGYETGLPAFRLSWGTHLLSGFTNMNDSVTVFTVHRTWYTGNSWSPVYQLFDRTYCVTNQITNDSPGTGLNGTTWKGANSCYCAYGTTTTNEIAYNYRYFSAPGMTMNISLTRKPTEPFVEMNRLYPRDENTMRMEFRMAYGNMIYAATNSYTAIRKGPLHQDCLLLGARINNPISGVFKNQCAADVGEFLLFFRNLSDEEIEKVQSYLINKWIDPSAAGCHDPVSVIVEEGAVAQAELEGVHTVNKEGGGTLTTPAAAAAAEGTLDIREGSVAFTQGLIGQKAAVWLDPSDPAAVTTNAAGFVTAITNKGVRGGVFSSYAPESTTVKLGNNYSASHKMLEYPAYGAPGCTFDFEDLGVNGEGTNETVTVFTILTQKLNNNGDANWNCALNIGPKRSAIGTAEPATKIRISSSGESWRSSSVEYWGGFSTQRDNPAVYSVAKWADDDYLLPTLVAVESTPVGARFMVENPIEGGSNCVTCLACYNEDRAYGLVRLGSRILGNAGTGEYWTGAIGEVLIFTQTLTSSEKQSVIDYLRAKWIVNGGTDVEPPTVLSGEMRPQPSTYADLTLRDGTGLRYCGSETTVNELTIASDSRVTVFLDTVPAAAAAVPLLRYTTAKISGVLTVEVPFDRKWKIRDDGEGTLWLRPFSGYYILLR